jgi:MOSC domain-containing protein YiiM
LRTLNLDGDGQADLSVHGGKYKAVYCYPIEHYDYWKKELPGRELPMAAFGENFTTAGLSEDSVHLGDMFSVGSAQVVVTQQPLQRGPHRLGSVGLGDRHDAHRVSPAPGRLALGHRSANGGQPGREAWEVHNPLIYRGMLGY